MQGTLLSTVHTLASYLTHSEGMVSRLIREGTGRDHIAGTWYSHKSNPRQIAPHAAEGRFRQCSEEHFGEEESQQGQMSQSGQGEWSVEESVSGKKGSSGLCLAFKWQFRSCYQTGHRRVPSYCFFSQKNKIVSSVFFWLWSEMYLCFSIRKYAESYKIKDKSHLMTYNLEINHHAIKLVLSF